MKSVYRFKLEAMFYGELKILLYSIVAIGNDTKGISPANIKTELESDMGKTVNDVVADQLGCSRHKWFKNPQNGIE